MIPFMQQIDADLSSSGELGYQQGLVDPFQTKTITASAERPVVTRSCARGQVGPFSASSR